MDLQNVDKILDYLIDSTPMIKYYSLLYIYKAIMCTDSKKLITRENLIREIARIRVYRNNPNGLYPIVLSKLYTAIQRNIIKKENIDAITDWLQAVHIALETGNKVPICP